MEKVIFQRNSPLRWEETSLDEEFLGFVETFREKVTPEIEMLLKKYSDKQVIRFGNREEMDDYISHKIVLL